MGHGPDAVAFVIQRGHGERSSSRAMFRSVLRFLCPSRFLRAIFASPGLAHAKVWLGFHAHFEADYGSLTGLAVFA